MHIDQKLLHSHVDKVIAKTQNFIRRVLFDVFRGKGK